MVTNLSAVLQYLYPAANSRVDWQLADPLDGAGARITYWNTAGLGTQPNQTTLETTEASAGYLAWFAEHGGDATSTTRLQAKELLDLADRWGKLFRSVAAVIVDEINILRQQVVGAATATWDPANMANGSGVTSPNITVTGAAFGDVVDVAAPYTLQGVTATGYVSAANTVNVRLHNGTGGAVNLASGTWTVVVRRHVALPDRTLVQARNAIKAAAGTAATDS